MGAVAGQFRLALRERALDRLLPLLPRPAVGGPGVVIVDIDRAALVRFGPWPWPRNRMAELVSAAAAGHPAVLALDILFAGPDRFSADGDAALAQALSAVPSVLGFVLETANSGQELPATPILSRVPVAVPGLWRTNGVIGPIPVLANAAQGFGALVLAADPDGPIRRVPLMVLAGSVVRPGLAVETVRLAQGAGALLIDRRGMLHRWRPRRAAWQRCVIAPLRDTGRVHDFGGEADRRTRGACHTRREDRADWQQRAGARRAARHPRLAGDAIGVDPGRGDRDDLRGQVAEPPGLGGHRRNRPAPRCSACSCLLLAARLRPAAAAVLAVLVCLAWAAAAAAAVPRPCLLIDPGGPARRGDRRLRRWPSLARFARDEWRARLLRLSFEQHLAPEVVRRIAADPAALRLRGEMREITALFTDIEGFTSMTERAEPTDLVALLDAYFDVATRIVTDHGGMIDKIVGDAIHAIFNAPFALEDHPQRAVASALALLDATEEVRRSPLGQRLQLGRTRIGIETGPAIVGDVGGSRKLDYTAHGNAMNAAARLEAANKDLGSAICIGPGAAARLDPATLRPIGTLTLRGQSGEICVYTPVSLAAAFSG